MPNPIRTHLLDDAGVRLCGAHDGLTTPETFLLDGACDPGVVFCPPCARAALIPIVELAQSRSAGDPLLDSIAFFTQTPPEMEAAVLRVLAPALASLEDHVERIGGRHD